MFPITWKLTFCIMVLVRWCEFNVRLSFTWLMHVWSGLRSRNCHNIHECVCPFPHAFWRAYVELIPILKYTTSVMITRLMLNLRDPALLVISEDRQRSRIRFGISQNVPSLSLVGTGNEVVFATDHTRVEDNTLDGDVELSTMTRHGSPLHPC